MNCEFCQKNVGQNCMCGIRINSIEYTICVECNAKILALKKLSHIEQLEWVRSELVGILRGSTNHVTRNDIDVLQNKISEFLYDN